MKRLVSKMIAFALTLVVAITMIPDTMQKAYADSGVPAMVKGTSVLAKNVNKDGLQKIWFGRYLDPPTKKRMWYVIGYDGQGDNPASRENLITILHKNIPSFSGGERFSGNSNESYANQYSVADIRWIVNRYYNAINSDWKWNNSKEKGIIVKRRLEGGGSNYGEEGYDENKIKGNSVEDAGFWLLSCGEAEALPGGVRHLYNDNTWWLRSPGQYDGKAAYCWTDYNYNYTVVIRDGVSTDTYHGVRPACDLDMNAILFTSAAEGGKVSGSGADALTKVGNNKNDEWKLTIKDADRDSFDITTCEGSYDSESGAVTFWYDGAKVESKSYISAAILGNDDSIKYYGRVAEVSEESGQVTINTSGKMESGDKLFVFNEQYNGDKTTDYASDLKELALSTSGDHEWAEATCTHPKTCEICGETEGDALPHDYQDIDGTAVEPSCIKVGKKADKQCSRCGNVIEGEALPALGHKWIVDETTDQDGWRAWTTGTMVHEARTCERCRFEERRDYEEGHDHGSVSMSFAEEKPATCTTDGVREHYVCTCGGWFEDTGEGPGNEPMSQEAFVIKATGHVWKAADCTHPKTCEVCGDTEGSNLGHYRKFTGWTWKGNEEQGYTEAVAGYICIREGCGDIINKRMTPTKRVVEPTCTKGGWTEYKVQIGSVDAPDLTTRSSKKDAEFTEPTGHEYKEVENTAQEASCTEPGKKADRECSKCHEMIEGEVIPALDHDWDDGVVTTEPTADTEGVMTYTCSRCDATKTEPIDKLKPSPSGGAEVNPQPAPDGDPDQKGSDGTAVGPGASAAAAEKAITNMVSDSDPAGTVFGKLALKSPKQGKTSINLNWNAVPDANSYVIYGNKCGNGIKPVKLAEARSNTHVISAIGSQKLKKGTYYKFIIVALDKNNKVVSTSKVIHVATKGGKVGNHKKVTVKNSVIKKAKKLKKGKSLKLKAKAVPQTKKLKVKKHRAVMYESDDINIATVSKKGVVKAKNKGTCYIYAYAQNGVSRKIKIIVK